MLLAFGQLLRCVGAGGEAIGMFFGQMLGGAKGAAEVAYKSTKEALGKRK